MRGYLGTSTKNRPNKSGNKGKGNANRRRRRRSSQHDYPDDDGNLEVIPPEQLEASKNMMNLAELKNRPAAKLVELGESLGIEPSPALAALEERILLHDPALDVSEDTDNVFVKVELPGMKKEEIDISLHEEVLSISGERKHEEEKEEGELFRSERFFGKFHRSVALPATIAGDKVSATYKDGILSVTLPNAVEAKPKRIPVSIS